MENAELCIFFCFSVFPVVGVFTNHIHIAGARVSRVLTLYTFHQTIPLQSSLVFGFTHPIIHQPPSKSRNNFFFYYLSFLSKFYVK